MTSHQSSWLKQSNKSHKRTHRSKGEIDRQTNGKIRKRKASVASVRTTLTVGTAKSNRTNSSRILRRNKKQKLVKDKVKSGLGTLVSIGNASNPGKKEFNGAPKNVVIVPLSFSKSAERLTKICQAVSQSLATTNDLIPQAPFVLMDEKHKLAASFLLPNKEMFAILDAAKCADVIIFILDVSPEESMNGKISIETCIGDAVDNYGRQVLSALKAQGMVSIIGACFGLETVPKKLSQKVKLQAKLFFEQEISNQTKFCLIGGTKPVSGVPPLIRALKEAKHKPLVWRANRSYMQSLNAAKDPTDENILHVEGYLRGKPWNIHHAVHISGYGTYSIHAVTNISQGLDAEDLDNVVHTDSSKLCSLEEEAEGDLLANEQTWPTKEELNVESHRDEVDEDKGDNKEHYMQDWIPSDDESWDGADEAADDVDEDMETELEKRARDEEDEKLFPDETEVPHGVLARERFVKYRGLDSVKHSYWHPKESLPREYFHLYQLEHLKVVEKDVMDETEKWGNVSAKAQEATRKLPFTISSGSSNQDVIVPGNKIRISLKVHKPDILAILEDPDPLVLSSLHEHEVKLSVIDMTVKKWTQDKPVITPVKSKDVLTLQCGFWRRKTRPVFYERSTNSQNHKFLKYLPESDFAGAVAYGPISFGVALPTLFFQENEEGTELVANGTLATIDPDKIILKRIILTGFPVRIKKLKVVVRFMFHNPEDVQWFKPVKIWTKHGAKGEIIDSVGTHGLFKSRFDRFIQSNDTVCMSLYKRVFPKPVNEFQNLS